MNNRARIAIIALVAAGVVVALVLRQQDLDTPAAAASEVMPELVVSGQPAVAALPARRPRLVELGASRCQSCKLMKEELALLGQECPDTLEIEMIDVWQDEASAKRYGVDVIPTQVFLDADGKELSRHIGFIPRAEILARFAPTGASCGTRKSSPAPSETSK